MIMRKKVLNISASFALLASVVAGLASCNNWLDVVPDDGIPEVETAFNLRATAIRYLATCYSYMPMDGLPAYDSGMMTGDELWDLEGRIVSNTSARVSSVMSNIAKGRMSASSVYGNDFSSMYEGIRCCDILVDHVFDVPDMTREEKEQWVAEAKFLKAFYHFNLVRKWGPVPVIKKSLPIDSDVETVRVYRDNIDTCFNYILRLLEEAEPFLPATNASIDEYGRINQKICAALRARVATYAASPLFNGNPDQAALIDNRGNALFPEKSAPEKLERWRYAMDACKHAITVCEAEGVKLYDTSLISYPFTDSLRITLALRNSFNQRWAEDNGNPEIIWANTQMLSYPAGVSKANTLAFFFQRLCLPILIPGRTDMLGGYRFIGAPLKIAEQFYTNHGIPIQNDLAWEGVNTMALRTGDAVHNYYIEEGYTTIQLNFDREPRFYASLGFDGGTWLGQLSNYNRKLDPENVYFVSCRQGGQQGKTSAETGPVTGYFPKKLFNYQSTWTGDTSPSMYLYAWPMIRLSDLYLLYAECINEVEGPNGANSVELYKYLNAVRSRAAIPDVKTSWDNFSNNPGYYNSQSGMRDIIHRERLNELTFESQRYWDLRRWKEASAEYSKGIYGFHIIGSSPEDYYVRTFISEQPFGLKNYFWPIATSYIEVNPNMVQNLGW